MSAVAHCGYTSREDMNILLEEMIVSLIRVSFATKFDQKSEPTHLPSQLHRLHCIYW